MSALSRELDNYLAVRRGLGFALRTDERILRRFIEYAERMSVEHVNAEAFMGWRKSFGDANQQTWSRRLGIVRIFAQWLHGIDPRHEVPSRDLIPSRQRRSRPHIYSPSEIRAIVQAAASLPSINGIRALTYPSLFGLIAVTGLRISEALSLDSGDGGLCKGARSAARTRFTAVLRRRSWRAGQRLRRPIQLRLGLPVAWPSRKAEIQ